MATPQDVVGYESRNGNVFCPSHRQQNARAVRVFDGDFDHQPQCCVCLVKIPVWIPVKIFGLKYKVVPASVRINP